VDRFIYFSLHQLITMLVLMVLIKKRRTSVKEVGAIATLVGLFAFIDNRTITGIALLFGFLSYVVILVKFNGYPIKQAVPFAAAVDFFILAFDFLTIFLALQWLGPENFLWRVAPVQLLLLTGFALGTAYLAIKATSKLRAFIKSEKSHQQLFMVFSLFLAFCTHGILFWWNEVDYDLSILHIFFIFTVVFALLAFISIYIYSKTVKNKYEQKRLKSEMEIQKRYTEKVETLYEEMRALHHDYRNLLFGFQGYLEDKDWDGATNYYEENMARVSQTLDKADFGTSQLKNLKVSAVKGLMSAKIMSAQTHGVEIKVECTEPITEIDMDVVDFCKCLGILLDNAIEEVLHLADKKVAVAFMKEEDHIWIVVSNPCRSELPTVKLLFKKGYSTKGEGRGLGLSNFAEIVNKQSNAQRETHRQGNVFNQHLKIFKKI